MKKEKQYVITESQLKTVIKDVIKEQGLYGNPNDVVDYDLPEYLSDVIILRSLESMGDVQNSVKELHKRLMRLEKGLDTAGSHQKAYGTGLDYSEKNNYDIVMRADGAALYAKKYINITQEIISELQ